MILLDKHCWIWWLHQDKKLPKFLKTMIETADKLAVSSVSIYER